MQKTFDREIIQGIMSDRNSEGSYDRQLKAKLLQGFLDVNLTKTQKEYIILYYKNQMKISDIAHIYGVAPSTVCRTLGRARRRLYRSLTGRELLLRYSSKQNGDLSCQNSRR